MISCHYCDRPANSRDHIVPRRLGGPDALWNLVMSCGPCNMRKKDNWPSCQCEGCRSAVGEFLTDKARAESAGAAILARIEKNEEMVIAYQDQVSRAIERGLNLQRALADVSVFQ